MNPMRKTRCSATGASRYYSDLYKEAFGWECEALSMVREQMGLSNMKIMIPFLRTIEEAKKS